jgi:hypothetical protein
MATNTDYDLNRRVNGIIIIDISMRLNLDVIPSYV